MSEQNKPGSDRNNTKLAAIAGGVVAVGAGLVLVLAPKGVDKPDTPAPAAANEATSLRRTLSPRMIPLLPTWRETT